jgi:hypothetical protein
MNTGLEPIGIDRNRLIFLPLKTNRFDWQFGQRISKGFCRTLKMIAPFS